MLERELKFHVPATAQAAVLRTLTQAGARTLALHARYVDTPTRELAQRRLALRLRLEGHQWVQTLKAPGPDTFSRVEYNHVRPEPTLDLRLYDGEPAAAMLAGLAGPLYPLYETRIERLTAQYTVGDTRIELAYDRGVIASGLVDVPVCELELELVEGRIEDLFTVAHQWVADHGLVLDLRTKAERGNLVADAALQVGDQIRLAPDALAEILLPARRGRPAPLPAGLTAAGTACHALDDPLQQVIRNATLLAGAETAAPTAAHTIEHIHQLRVGIRRLRSLWRFFQDWHTPQPEVVQALRTAFQALGQSRDEDVVRTEVLPRLTAAGLPEPPLRDDTVADAPDTAALVAAPAFQGLLLSLLQGQTAPTDDAPPLTPVELRAALTDRLNRDLRRIRRGGRQFADLPVEKRHDLRKRVKRLRYAVDACANQLQPARTRALLSALSAVQTCLGEYNDLTVAESWFAERTTRQPATAWFAIGWLRASQERCVTQAAELLRRLDGIGRFKPA